MIAKPGNKTALTFVTWPKYFRCYWPFVQGLHWPWDLHLNKRFSKQSRRQRFETSLYSLWQHYNELPKFTAKYISNMYIMVSQPKQWLLGDVSHWKAYSLTKVVGFYQRHLFSSNTRQICHNEHDGISIHRCLDGLLNCLFRLRSGSENIKVPCHWPLWGELTGDRWIPHTKAQ